MYWYTQIVYRWRSVSSAAWLLVLATPALLIYRLISTFSLMHPLQWTTECIPLLLSFRLLIFTCLYLFSLSTIMILYSLTATVRLPVYATRLSILGALVSPAHLIVIILFAMCGGCGGHCLAQLSGHRLWGQEGLIDEVCLFLTLHGAFIGLCFGSNYYVGKEVLLVVPSVQQPKLFALRGHLNAHVWEGALWTIKELRFYYLLYYMLGGYLRSKVMAFLSLQLQDSVPLNSLYGLMNPDLLLQAFLAGTVLHSTWSFGLRIFRVFQSEAICFPVVATFSNEATRLLIAAMKSKHIPLLRCLGYLDLCQLAVHSHHRRKQVFSLDGGGRPGVWEDVCGECISLIDSLTCRLMGRKDTPSDPITMTIQQTPSQGVSPSFSKGWSQSPPPALMRRGIREDDKARLWSYSPPVVTRSPPVQGQPAPSHVLVKQVGGAVTRVKGFPGRLADSLKKKPFFIHFLSTFPEAVEQSVYAESKLLVWAITGLSELVVASYSEDQYGVVQSTLTRVLTSLIDLSQALDKHVKAPLSSAPSTRNVQIALEKNGKYAIKTAVQTGLYRLLTTFSREKRSLQLSDMQLTYWNTFILPSGP